MTSAWMRATAPSGDASFEGSVAWSGELGYGVREPEPGQLADDRPAETDDVPADADAHGGGHH
jgi:NADH-quinone oxidoreductase subunit I